MSGLLLADALVDQVRQVSMELAGIWCGQAQRDRLQVDLHATSAEGNSRGTFTLP
jgi:hypothetical protein